MEAVVSPFNGPVFLGWKHGVFFVTWSNMATWKKTKLEHPLVIILSSGVDAVERKANVLVWCCFAKGEARSDKPPRKIFAG